MKKIDIGQAIQIVANIGVIAGIALIAVQLRQNNDLLGIQIRSNRLDRVTSTAEIVLENPYLLELLAKEPSTLTSTEQDALLVLGIRSLSNFEAAYEDVEQGLADEAVLRLQMKSLWNRPHLNYGMPLAWSTFKERGNRDFVAWMEQYVVNSDK
jgi:hypothetical protein